MSKNNSSSVLSKIVVFVGIVFLLLGVLFGAQIFTFIFGSIGQANVASISLVPNTQINLTGAFINTTTFTIPQASQLNFSGSVLVIEAFNATDDTLIPEANFTMDAATGTITNATLAAYNDVILSYTWNQKSPAQLSAESVNNNSLVAVVAYTEQADTQLNTAAIAITLLILIALFLVFWVAFIRPMMIQNSGKTTGGNFT